MLLLCSSARAVVSFKAAESHAGVLRTFLSVCAGRMQKRASLRGILQVNRNDAVSEGCLDSAVSAIVCVTTN